MESRSTGQTKGSGTKRKRFPVRFYLGFTMLLAAGGLVLGLVPTTDDPGAGIEAARWREMPSRVELLVSLLFVFGTYEIYRRAPRRLRWLGVALSLAASVRYITWRIYATLNFETPANAIACGLLLAAELYALSMLFLGQFQTFWPKRRVTPPMPAGAAWPPVDVYITTYNEDVDLVRRTAVGCAGLDYPDKRVWILDDGRRPEMMALADEVGVGYLTRPDNRHAKAGNLNHALAHTSGTLIAQFDADHVPVSSFLRETVPFFIGHPGLAFVQTPHNFYNLEAYQRNLLLGTRVANEQDLFFHVIQPGNDRWNAAFFCGSNAVIRREALDSIGGFATETVTEDAHTALRLHAGGWRSFYYDRNLAGGLSPENFGDLVAQRLRWGMGMCSILKQDNPLFLKGLSLPQRLCYLSASFFFMYGLPRIAYFLAPVVFLLTGISPIDGGILKVTTYYLPHFLAGIFVTSALSRNLRHTFWSEVYETALSFPMAVSTIWALCTRRRLPFKVTPKDSRNDKIRFNLRTAGPQAVLLVLTGAAMISGVASVGTTGESGGVVAMNLFWCAYNFLLLAASVLVSVDRPQQRKEPRVPCFRDVQLAFRLAGSEVCRDGVAVDLTESGARLLLRAPVPAEVPLTLRIDPESDPLEVPAEVVRNDGRAKDGLFAVSIRFPAYGIPTRHRLIQRMYGAPDTWATGPQPESSWASFVRLSATVFRWSAAQENAFLRRSHRFPCRRPGILEIGDAPRAVTLLNISESGAFVTGERLARLQPGTSCRLGFTLTDGERLVVAARIVARRNHGVALRFDNLDPAVRTAILWDLYVAPLRHSERAAPPEPAQASRNRRVVPAR